MDSGLFTQAHLICHHKTIKKNTVLLMLSFSPFLHPFPSLCKGIYQDTNSYNDPANISEHLVLRTCPGELLTNAGSRRN